MSRTDRTIRVQPIPGEPLRYYVESWSSPSRPHIVDLAENQGNGACSCRDFVTRRQPNIDKLMPLFSRETSCRHVIAARRHFTIHTLTDIAREISCQRIIRKNPNATTWASAARSTTKGSALPASSSRRSSQGLPPAEQFQTTASHAAERLAEPSPSL
jgi:hypothetical protein